MSNMTSCVLQKELGNPLKLIVTITSLQLLALGPLSAAAVVVGRLDNFKLNTAQEERDHFNTNSAGIWLLVILSLAIVLELLVVLLRFLNFDLILNYKTPLVAVSEHCNIWPINISFISILLKTQQL